MSMFDLFTLFVLPSKHSSSQRGYQIRLRELDPNRRRYDLLKANSEFYQAVDLGDPSRIWHATFATMRQDLENMLAVMNLTEGTSNVLHINFDDLMKDISSSVLSILNHLFESPQPFKQPPPPWYRTLSQIEEELLPKLIKEVSLKQPQHVQAATEKSIWMKELSDLVHSSQEFVEIVRMEDWYWGWWERNGMNPKLTK
eukprot:CAMPEP_0201522430 /NCGR_PEP_ID=MMETSP0161_2-20130828/17417_1 /ASSEMBLY_ACC=CAM_ASM_000251 /TAXON_ID=180227 /ORGANISM="Neoparamoeba aestuarina, Strain SoJaBio B1-5/56/2" /LENGTH=198 /DNA_ID=CAMNT_0047921275 /DNA_START=355 /DNA_END=950 /DNA_ORIENTATION=-